MTREEAHEVCIELAAAAAERVAQATQLVADQGLVVKVAGIPHLHPAAAAAQVDRRLVLDALELAHRFRPRWWNRWPSRVMKHSEGDKP